MKEYWGKETPSPVENGKSKEIIIHEPKILETVKNRIYFYSEVDRVEVLQLNRELLEIKNESIYSTLAYDTPAPYSIFLHLNSYGGSVFAGLAAMDHILSIKKSVPVITIVDGCCASAATFLSVVGTKRLINKNAFMLIHQLSSFMWGKFQEVEDEMENLKKLMETIKRIYKERTNIPEKELNKILKHDLWFDADTCLKYGLVDEIIG